MQLESLAPVLRRGFSLGFHATRVDCQSGLLRPDMPLALSDHQLELVMTAASPLPPEKRIVLVERIVAALYVRAGVFRKPTDAELEHATRVALRGLIQAPAAEPADAYAIPR
jgi:hypothetical protein